MEKYSDQDLTKIHTHDTGVGELYEFTRDLASEHPDVFKGGCNNCVGAVLKQAKVIGENDRTDSNAGCTHVYFKSRRNGSRFVTKLNKFIGRQTNASKTAAWSR